MGLKKNCIVRLQLKINVLGIGIRKDYCIIYIIYRPTVRSLCHCRLITRAIVSTVIFQPVIIEKL